MQYDHINDLMNEGLGESSGYADHGDIFSVTFNFPYDQKEMVENFISKRTKDFVVEMIVREAEKEWV